MHIPDNIFNAWTDANVDDFLLSSWMLMLILNFILAFVIIYQLLAHIRTFHKIKSKKNLIFLQILIEVGLNLTHTSFYFANAIYLLDTYIRHVVFLYLIHFFIKKSLKINEFDHNLRTKKKMALAFTLICFIYFTAIVIYGGFIDTENPVCMESYFLSLRIVGIFLTVVFIIIGYHLIQKYFKNMNGLYRDFWALLFRENQSINPNNNFLEKQTINLLKTDENIYDLCKIIGYHMASAFLTVFLTIYSSFYMANTENCVFFGLVFENPISENIYFDVILAWFINMINYYLPIIIIINVFWLKQQKKKGSSYLLSVSDGGQQQYFDQLLFKKPPELEEEEKSSVSKVEKSSRSFGKQDQP